MEDNMNVVCPNCHTSSDLDQKKGKLMEDDGSTREYCCRSISRAPGISCRKHRSCAAKESFYHVGLWHGRDSIPSDYHHQHACICVAIGQV